MTFSYKRCFSLDPPGRDDFRADQERILDALKPLDASMPLSVMRKLYPLVSDAGYRVTVTLCPGRNGLEVTRVEPGDTTGSLYGLALDIGSTTLEMELVDMLSGKTVAHSGCVNSQVRFGLNILDRILAVKEDRNNLEQLRCLVAEDIRGLTDQVCAGAGIGREEISALIVGGNTTMIHFLLGCDPWLVFQSPYAPVFFDPGILSARELDLQLDCNVYCFPAVANYLGGDITAG